MPSRSRIRWWPWAIAFLAAASLGGAIPRLSTETLAGTFVDDAYYYLQTARHVAAGNGVTFDGIHRTNGVHPLWLGLLFLIMRLVPGDFGPLYATAILEAGLVGISVLLLCRNLRDEAGPAATISGTLLLVALPGASITMRGGMEAALFALLLVAAWLTWRKLANSASNENRTGAWLAVGLLCGLLTLTRLEGTAGAAVLAWVSRRTLARNRRALLALVAPPLLAGMAWLLASHAWVGLWLPVSGSTKAVLAAQQPLAERLRRIVVDIPWPGAKLLARTASKNDLCHAPAWMQILSTGALVLTVALAWRWRARWASSIRGLGALLAITGLITLGDLVVMEELRPWHEAPALLFTAVFVVALLARMRSVARAVALLAMLATAARLPKTLADRRNGTRGMASFQLAGALWLRKELPPGTPVGSWDAGLIGYFSHRPVVCLGGLVMDKPFYESVVRGPPEGHEARLRRYLRDSRIDWIAQPHRASNPKVGMGLDDDFERAATIHDQASVDGWPGVAIWRRRR